MIEMAGREGFAMQHGMARSNFQRLILIQSFAFIISPVGLELTN